MPAENITLSLLSIISLVSFFVVFLVSKFSNKIGNGILLDQDFNKPQAFHKDSVSRSGGLAGTISLSIFFILYYFLFEKILIDYIALSLSMFLIGFLEDIKFKINPNYRLLLMIIFLSFFIIFFSIRVGSVDLNFFKSMD